MASFKPCPGCGNPIRTDRKNGCASCYRQQQQEGARERYEAKRVIPIQGFEPQAAPDEKWDGRPFDDPRNNFRKPAWTQGVPMRDVLASPIRVAVIDIECSGLDASFGRVLCGVTRLFSPDEVRVRRADEYDEWNTGRRGSDAKLVEAILRDVEEADIILGHNATAYDLPFLRTRALIHGLPPVHPKKIIDPVLLARKTFRFHSNSLDSISMMIGTSESKTRLNPRIWAAALMDGDRAALDEITDHCIKDVDVLCEVARRVAPYVKQIDTIGSWR